MEEIVTKESYVRFNGKRLFYVSMGEGFPVIILLGWSSDLKNFPYQEVLMPNWEYLESFKLFFLHLSNFSKSGVSESPFNLEDYAIELRDVLIKFGFEKINLIGHSAGGRIAAYFAIKFGRNVNKLVLMNSAGLKHKNIYNTDLDRVRFYFSRKRIMGMERKKILKETFENVYNTDLTPKLSSIKVPTLIIWGGEDRTIDISRAYIFNKRIVNSQLIIYPQVGHLTTYEPTVFLRVFNFLNDP